MCRDATYPNFWVCQAYLAALMIRTADSDDLFKDINHSDRLPRFEGVCGYAIRSVPENKLDAAAYGHLLSNISRFLYASISSCDVFNLCGVFYEKLQLHSQALTFYQKARRLVRTNDEKEGVSRNLARAITRVPQTYQQKTKANVWEALKFMKSKQYGRVSTLYIFMVYVLCL